MSWILWTIAFLSIVIAIFSVIYGAIKWTKDEKQIKTNSKHSKGIQDIHQWVILDENWYDKDWYDRDWYDKYWYDKNWYDKKWFDREWYDKNWYDKKWFDRTWYDKEWYDKKWFDRTWYDRQWFNKDWFDKYWQHKSKISSRYALINWGLDYDDRHRRTK